MSNLMSKAIKYILDDNYRFSVNDAHLLYKSTPDAQYLKRKFKVSLGYPLDLENPQTFNEKLQWLKLNDRKSIYSTMVDKYSVKDYVASIIGEDYIIPTLGVWDKFDDIDFDALPNQFVLKCTHDSGGLVICKDKNKLDKNAARKKLNRSLKTNYYCRFREWPYKNVKPRIIAEKYMEDHSTSELRDYKFFCFGGMAKCYKVDFDRFVEHRANYFSADGELMRIGEEICPPDFNKEIPVPENLEKMKEFAEKLSAAQPFLRADFYDVDGHVYFGELTFYPASGFGKFIFDGNDELLGSWIKLPEKSKVGGYYLIYKDMLCVLNTRAINLEKDRSNSSHGLADYKIHSFNGVPKVILVCRDRFSDLGLTEDFFDQNWTHLDVQREIHPNSDTVIEKPRELDKMLELAEKLSKDVPFLRSDFYTIDGKVYFGELTFYPASGFEGFQPASFDRKLGDWLVLPDVGGALLIRDNCYVWVSVSNKDESKDTPPIRDYKIYTFNGEAKMCMINQDRGHHTRADYFDKNYKWLDFTWGYDHADAPPEKPKNYEKMFELAEKLAAGTPELRVDFYEVDGRIYFGELTFFDGSGFDKIEPKYFDELLGSWIKLPRNSMD